MIKSWILFLLISALASPLFAFDRSYPVRGVAESVGVVEGVAFSSAPNPEVTGQLTDSKGLAYSFEGTWVGNGHISGETDTGETVDLITQPY